MSILITGFPGFSGRHLLDYFSQKGNTVYVLVRSDAQAIAPKYFLKKNIKFLHTPLESLRALPHSIDCIIHAASVSPQPHTLTCDFINNNIFGTKNLIRIAKENDVKKFIFFSTISVYGEVEDPILTESTSIKNPNTYGMSKLLGELCLKDASLETSLAIRLPAVIGDGARRHWLANTVEKAQKGQDIRIFNPKALFNNIIHIEELCRFIEKIINSSWKGFDAINIASMEGMEIEKLVQLIVETLGSSSSIILDSATHLSFSICIEKAKNFYNYLPISTESALVKYLKNLTDEVSEKLAG